MKLRIPLVLALGALTACSSPEPVVYRQPSREEKGVRAAFVDSHADFTPRVKRQLLGFNTTPEAALRRVEYVRAHADLPGVWKQFILAGEVRLHMKDEHVRAAWGEPSQTRNTGGLVEWTYPVFSRRGVSREAKLYFRAGELVDVRK